MQSSVFFPFLAFEIIFETQHYIMKKLMFTLALSALVTMGVKAQKQMGGEHNIEVAFTPFGESPISGSALKYRYFLDDDKALRVSVRANSSTDTYAWYQDGEINEADPVSPQLNIATSTVNLGISAGLEKHFDGMDNLSPYIAGVLNLNTYGKADLQEFWGPQDINDAGQPDQYVVWHLLNSQGSFQIGVDLLFGVDYYFSDAIYLGFEAGLGFSALSWSNHNISTDNLTAFNMYFNNAFSTEQAGSEVAGEFSGELPFSAIDGVIYNEYWPDGAGSDDLYYPWPNHLSNTTLGNMFQAGLRLG